ncbi:ABC transporter permease [Bacillus sp. AFS076308]|uniref:carbohydrate ABC transporter permease n=1 Tax=unclassified Bacillus (in: firmicutes) TaxID=185979 RepID=UPI000BF92D31|nr:MULTISPECIES: sugar ABC transporter permease [unclassified Bacillus (in: firmicutes)]PFN78146.1 ABC transporter permease [Bacillus sp. AFS076308]PGV48653.1 ABC transporter permease [Bacillus sp. AFS037270]
MEKTEIAMQRKDKLSIESTRENISPKKRNRTNYLYIVPAFLLMGVFVYYTIADTIYTSFFDWNGISPDKTFIGLTNYFNIFKDPIFYISLKNTVIFLFLTIFIQMFLGLLIAVLLNANVKFKGVYKVIFFLPTVLSAAVISQVFRQIYNASNGELNNFLSSIGLDSLAKSWLADPDISLFAITSINIWEFTGFSMIMYFAALTVIDKSLFEAARLDGANFLQIMRFIIFPQLRFTHYSLIILGVIGSLKTFDIIYLTTGGGPGRSTEFISTYIFKKAILEFNAGYSSALSVILLIIALVVTVIQLRIYRN